MDLVVRGLQAPPLRQVEVAEMEVLEPQRSGVALGQPLDRVPAALARGLHGRQQLAERFAVRGPDHGRRLAGRPRRPWGQRPEFRDVVREDRGGGAGLYLLQELRGELAGRDLGEGQVVDDLTDRPVLFARLPVGLALGEAFDLAQHAGARALQLVPQGFDRCWNGHRHSSRPVVDFVWSIPEDVVMTDRRRALARAAWRTVVLVGQYRYAARDFYWEMPTGAVRAGESEEAAVQRELAEEAGYEAGRLVKVCSFHSSKSVMDDTVHIYLAEQLRAVVRDGDDTEFIEVRSFAFDEVLHMVETSEIRDAMTVVAVLHAA